MPHKVDSCLNYTENGQQPHTISNSVTVIPDYFNSSMQMYVVYVVLNKFMNGL